MHISPKFARLFPVPVIVLLLAVTPLMAGAGVGNPNLSVIAQPRLVITGDPEDPSRNRPVWDIGETEFVLDDYLNPYVRGNLTLAYAPEEGLALEEGYFDVVRGLPGTLNLRVGQWRSGFGKLNALHPHVYPFAERFGVLAAFLPGEEGLNETGLQASLRLPSPGDMALTASVDWLQGDSFRRERDATDPETDPLSTTDAGDRADESRPAALARLSAFAPVGERSGLELGLSATEGTNNVAAGTRTRVLGFDAKAKLWNSERSYLLLQGEALQLTREDAGWDGFAYTNDEVSPWGWYLFADYNWNQERRRLVRALPAGWRGPGLEPRGGPVRRLRGDGGNHGAAPGLASRTDGSSRRRRGTGRHRCRDAARHLVDGPAQGTPVLGGRHEVQQPAQGRPVRPGGAGRHLLGILRGRR